mmetsp:Transcript_6243/g.19293  ORF Transcript_6243/g.19293 Transcript_6243/m.19293 type:complete len:284 (+) Transcript_6243:340-1191(+)
MSHGKRPLCVPWVQSTAATRLAPARVRGRTALLRRRRRSRPEQRQGVRPVQRQRGRRRRPTSVGGPPMERRGLWRQRQRYCMTQRHFRSLWTQAGPRCAMAPRQSGGMVTEMRPRVRLRTSCLCGAYWKTLRAAGAAQKAAHSAASLMSMPKPTRPPPAAAMVRMHARRAPLLRPRREVPARNAQSRLSGWPRSRSWRKPSSWRKSRSWRKPRAWARPSGWPRQRSFQKQARRWKPRGWQRLGGWRRPSGWPRRSGVRRPRTWPRQRSWRKRRAWRWALQAAL